MLVRANRIYTPAKSHKDLEIILYIAVEGNESTPENIT